MHAKCTPSGSEQSELDGAEACSRSRATTCRAVAGRGYPESDEPAEGIAEEQDGGPVAGRAGHGGLPVVGSRRGRFCVPPLRAGGTAPVEARGQGPRLGDPAARMCGEHIPRRGWKVWALTGRAGAVPEGESRHPR